jgi:hypothetical protein
VDQKFIPDDVAQFVTDKIDSVAELEALALTGNRNEDRPFFYFVRFLSFMLIAVASAGKNFAKRRHP